MATWNSPKAESSTFWLGILTSYWPEGIIAITLADPDQVRRSNRFGNASLFSRWYDVLSKHVVVVVIDEPNGRKWVVTAYIARKLVAGAVQWERA